VQDNNIIKHVQIEEAHRYLVFLQADDIEHIKVKQNPILKDSQFESTTSKQTYIVVVCL